MSRNYKPMPPIWRLNELFELSDDCPNGLIWRVNKAKSKPGDPVGKLNKATGYYMVSVDNVHGSPYCLLFKNIQMSRHSQRSASRKYKR